MARRGKGDGAVEKLPSGNWRAVLVLGRDPDTGRRVRATGTFPTKTAASAWLADRRAEKAAGRVSVGGRVTLGEWAGRWLGVAATRIEPGSLKFYRERVDRQIGPRLGAVRLSDLTPERVADWYAGMRAAGVPAGEQHKSGTTLRACLAEAVRLGLIPSNPAARVKRPKVRPKEAEAFTLPQARAVLAGAAGWFAAYVRLGFDAGLRPSELLALHWEDVGLAAGTVRVRWTLDDKAKPPALKPPKTDAGRRSVLVGRPTADALARLADDQRAVGGPNPKGLVFPGRFGGFRGISNVSGREWRPLLRRAGVPALGLYALRHTSATLLLAAGVNVKVVSQRLGHRDIATTLRFYAHAMPDMQSRAAEVAGELFG